MKNHCFTLSLRNREKHQQDVFSYSATRHYHGLLYCLFSESDSIHELLNVQYCCCLYFHLNLIEDENYDIRYCCFVLADTVSLKDSMLRRYFGDFNREFYEQSSSFVSLLLIAYFDFFKCLKFDYFILNYSAILKQFLRFREFFFLMSQVFYFEFSLDFLTQVCYST